MQGKTGMCCAADSYVILKRSELRTVVRGKNRVCYITSRIVVGFVFHHNLKLKNVLQIGLCLLFIETEQGISV